MSSPWFFFLVTTVHTQAVRLRVSEGVSCKKPKAFGKKISFTYSSLCVKRVKVAWVRRTHIIIFSLKWRSQGAFLIYIWGKWQLLVLSTSLPLWLAFWSATTVISRNKARWRRGTTLTRALSHLQVLLWLNYQPKSGTVKGAEYDDAVLRAAPPLSDKVVNQAALDVWERLEMNSVGQPQPLWL